MSKQADTAVTKWQHTCKDRKGKEVIRQIVDQDYCRVCGYEHEED